jgi:hypothetical protein
MKRSTKIILSIFGVLAVLTVAGAGLAVWFIANNAERWAGQAKDRMQEGRDAGANLDSSGCVDATMARYRKDTGPISAIGERLWLTGCLDTATVDASICPESTAESITGRVGEMIAQRAAFCVKHGVAGDSDCQQLAMAVEEFCTGTPSAEDALLGDPTSEVGPNADGETMPAEETVDAGNTSQQP